MSYANFKNNFSQPGKRLGAPILAAVSALTVLCLFVCFHRLSPFIYLTNDDLFLKTLASGEVTGIPAPWLWYIGYPAGFLIASLYRLCPALPWYGLFLCFAFGVTMAVVLFRLLKAAKTWHTRLILFCLFVLLSYGFLFLHIAELQYTTVTGMAGAGAIFLFFLADTADSLPETLKNHAGFFLLAALSFSIRDKGFLMLLPFIGMSGVVKFLDTKTVKRRKNLLAAGAFFFGVMLTVFLINQAAYGSAQWKAFGSYTVSSEIIYDYTGYPDYDEYRELYASLGITRSSYEAASRHYNILLEPAINQKTMNVLGEASSASVALSSAGLPEKLREMAAFFWERHLSYTDRPLNLLVYLCYLLFALCALFGKKSAAIRDILFTGIARMAVWVYLVYYGRLPARVSQAVYLAELAILLAIALRHELWCPKTEETQASRAIRPARVCWTVTLCLFAAAALRFGIPKARAAASEARSRLQFSASFAELKDYFSTHPEAFYYLDMNSFGSFTEDALAGGENKYGNYLFMGSWVPHSPWYSAKFDRQQIAEDKAAEALWKVPEVYAVFMDTPETGFEYLQDFYAENHPGVTLETVETVPTSNGISFLIVRGFQAGGERAEAQN